jgi:hypothetical protein
VVLRGNRRVRGKSGGAFVASVCARDPLGAVAALLRVSGVPALLTNCAASSLPAPHTNLLSTAEHDFGESRLHYTYQLAFQQNTTPLHYFMRLFWPQFASLDRFLPSFLRLSALIAFHFLFITSRCTVTARILTTIQTLVNPLNPVDSKISRKYSQLPLSQNRAFSRRIAVFCDRVTARAARCCCTHVTYVLPRTANFDCGASIVLHIESALLNDTVSCCLRNFSPRP